jgi:hypothetical protein
MYEMAHTRVRAYRIGLVLAVLVSGMAAGGFGLRPALADVSAVKGSAFGVSISNLTIFGGAQDPVGPDPTVTLPAGGSASPVTKTAASEVVARGPATFLEAGTTNVSTQGTLGASGSVTSSAELNAITDAHGEQLTATKLSSTCTASESGASGSTTVTGGKLVTATDASQNPTTTVDVPNTPGPNTSIDGSFVLSATDTETFTWIFNEQTKNADGSITVTAAHEILHGPTAKGDLYLGQVVCGVSATAAGATTTTAAGGAATTTTAAAGATTTTSAASNATTTTSAAGAATTTTAAGGATTTTAAGAATTSGVGGGAYGYYTSVGLFGGAQATRGPEPAVTLPAAGADPPLTATAASGRAAYGPAEIFTSGKLDVSTQGTPGAAASVKSSATIANVGPGPINATGVTSNCTATQSGASGSATVTGGKLTTSEGANLDSAADDTIVDLPANPAPNTSFNAKLETVGDTFRVVLNEQTTSAGGITVNAVHMYLLGPTAVGDAIIGQSRCSTTTAAAGGTTGGGTAAGGSGTGMAGTGTEALRLFAFALLLLAGGSTTSFWANGRWGRRRPERLGRAWPKRGLLH